MLSLVGKFMNTFERRAFDKSEGLVSRVSSSFETKSQQGDL
jgi:hypothetical protein